MHLHFMHFYPKIKYKSLYLSIEKPTRTSGSNNAFPIILSSAYFSLPLNGSSRGFFSSHQRSEIPAIPVVSIVGETRQYTLHPLAFFTLFSSRDFSPLRRRHKLSKNRSCRIRLGEISRASNLISCERVRRAENFIFSSLIFGRENRFGCSATDYNLWENSREREKERTLSITKQFYTKTNFIRRLSHHRSELFDSFSARYQGESRRIEQKVGIKFPLTGKNVEKGSSLSWKHFQPVKLNKAFWYTGRTRGAAPILFRLIAIGKFASVLYNRSTDRLLFNTVFISEILKSNIRRRRTTIRQFSFMYLTSLHRKKKSYYLKSRLLPGD